MHTLGKNNNEHNSLWDSFYRNTVQYYVVLYFTLLCVSVTVPDHVTFLNQVTYSGNLVQTELPIERKPNQITFA